MRVAPASTLNPRAIVSRVMVFSRGRYGIKKRACPVWGLPSVPVYPFTREWGNFSAVKAAPSVRPKAEKSNLSTGACL